MRYLITQSFLLLLLVTSSALGSTPIRDVATTHTDTVEPVFVEYAFQQTSQCLTQDGFSQIQEDLSGVLLAAQDSGMEVIIVEETCQRFHTNDD